MKYRRRIYYSAEQRAEIWDRWQRGESMRSIGRVFGRERLQELEQEHGPIKALQCFPKMVVENDAAPAKACMLSKTLLELHAHNHALAQDANLHLLKMENHFAELFRQAQSAGDIDRSHDPQVLARRYQSDLLGLRVSAEREGVDAKAIAAEIANGLTGL